MASTECIIYLFPSENQEEFGQNLLRSNTNRNSTCTSHFYSEMKEEEITWCKKIHKKINQSRPYKHIFSTTIPDVRTINEIEEQLDQNKYLTIFDWSLDINTLTEELIEHFSNQRNLMLIACDFSSWFEKRLRKKAIFKEEIQQKQWNKCLKLVSTVADTYDNFARMLSGDKSGNADNRKKSAHNSNKKKFTTEELQAMQAAINEIKDDSILFGVMRILKKWMPEAEIAEDTTIDVSKLPKQCIEELMVLLGQM